MSTRIRDPGVSAECLTSNHSAALEHLVKPLRIWQPENAQHPLTQGLQMRIADFRDRSSLARSQMRLDRFAITYQPKYDPKQGSRQAI